MDQVHDRAFAYAIHDSATQWTEEPSATKVYFEPAQVQTLRPGPEYQTASRSGRMIPTAEYLPDVRGVDSVSLQDLTLHVQGLSGGGAGDGDDSSALDSTVLPLLKQCLGAEATGTGGVTDASDAGSGTTLEMSTGGSHSLNGSDVVLIRGATSGSYQARMIESNGTDTFTIDRPLTDDTGAADTPDEDEVVYAGRNLYSDPDLTGVANIAFFEQGSDYKRGFYGCLPSSASLSMSPNEIVQLTLGGIGCTAVDRSISDLSYSAPTTGDEIVAAPLIFHIGNTRMVAWDFSLDLGLNVSARPGSGGPNNVLGYVKKPCRPTLTCTLGVGSGTSPQELTETLRTTYQGSDKADDGTHDVSLQIGDQPGGTLYVRMPAVRITITGEGELDGMETVSLSCQASGRATRASSFFIGFL